MYLPGSPGSFGIGGPGGGGGDTGGGRGGDGWYGGGGGAQHGNTPSADLCRSAGGGGGGGGSGFGPAGVMFQTGVQAGDGKVVVSVNDTTPPTVSCSVTPTTLWPPNQQLVQVTASVTVSDRESGPAGFKLLSVTSSEPGGASDIQGWPIGVQVNAASGQQAGQLRAERLGSGQGRVYTLTYQGQDMAGNTATCTTTVTVPHDQR